MARLALWTLASLLLTSAAADAAEFRTFRLSDGRVISGEVVETGAEGMRVRINQGVVLVPYTLLADIQSADPAVLAVTTPLRIAIAPTEGAGPDQARLDGVLAAVGQIVPRVDLIDAPLWGRALGAGAHELKACKGQRDCLRGLGQRIRADLIVVPVVAGAAPAASLSLSGVDVTSNALLGASVVPIVGDDQDFGIQVAGAVFTALGITPEIDVPAAARTRLPRAEGPPPAAAAPSAPAPTPVADVPASKEPTPAPEAVAPTATTAAPPGETAGTGSTDLKEKGGATAPRARRLPSRGATIALGFLPVPGLGAGLLGDVPGVVLAAGGSVGLGWLSVYGIGSTAQTAPSFWAPSILVPYGIAVALNQLTTAIAWKRIEGRGQIAVLPVVGFQRDGGTFAFVGSF